MITQPPKTINAVLLGFLSDLISTMFSVLSLSTAFKLYANLAFASCTFISTSFAISRASSVWILASAYYFETIFWVYYAYFF